MPAAKDMSLNRGHFTQEQIENREKSKASVTPSVKLQVPDVIKSNVSYMRVWKATLKLYKGTQLLNALDSDLLARYCIEKHNLQELYGERDAYRKTGYYKARAVDNLYEEKDGAYNEIKITPETYLDTLLRLETRIEVKTKLLNQMAIALYMTPKARAGAVPMKPDKEPIDGNADMFD